ncbi:SDH family Clp fold serine proteinase [Nonomuraea typhae]|uniref:SDH family Clp fold serine proteinase n=1 Tax=Nonomuraea typhae TaxID=2603600 RepID=UPI0012FC7B04|nr:hypothetical protein [Nonomuraea typhae]
MAELTAQLAGLEARYGHPMILYAVDIADETVRVVYECLRAAGRTEKLGLVLSTTGGEITTARRLALLLREFTKELIVFVPYRARSAGTLLCLSADSLVLGPMAELSPIDANMASLAPPADGPATVSAEEVRLFRTMAETWFGVTGEEDRVQVLALVAQRMFPTSLSSLFRYDRLVRSIAHELLAYQLPDAGGAERDLIVNRLVEGFLSHEATIFRHEAAALGLKVRLAGEAEESLLWELAETCRHELQSWRGEGVTGLIAGPGFCARRVRNWVDDPAGEQLRTIWEM